MPIWPPLASYGVYTTTLPCSSPTSSLPSPTFSPPLTPLQHLLLLQPIMPSHSSISSQNHQPLPTTPWFELTPSFSPLSLHSPSLSACVASLSHPTLTPFLSASKLAPYSLRFPSPKRFIPKPSSSGLGPIYSSATPLFMLTPSINICIMHAKCLTRLLLKMSSHTMH